MACAGVPEEDERGGLFPYRDAIVRVDPLVVETSQRQPPRVAGASIVLRPGPSIHREMLARSLECHLARRIVCTDPQSCPLELGRVLVDVRDAGSAVVVDVRTDSPTRAPEMLRRAMALAPSVR